MIATLPPESRADAEAVWNGCQAHPYDPSDPEQFQQWYFLPWHRLMLAQFEGVIREVLQDEEFSLPYWNPVTGDPNDLIVPAVFRDPGTTLYNGTRWFWVNGGERIDTLYRDWITSGRPQREVLHRLAARAALASILGSTRTRTSSLISPSGATWPSSPRSEATRCSTSTTPTSTGSGKAGTGSATRIPTDPKYLDRKFAYGDRSGKRVDLPVSSSDRTAQLGYEYDGYEKPPQPQNLTAEQAAERVRTYKKLHEQALGGSHAGGRGTSPSGVK